MRSPSALLAASLLAVAACWDGSGSTRKGPGEACGAEAECSFGLVCFERVCAASYAASAACAPPGSPRLVLGGPITLADPGENVCVTAARPPFPAEDFESLGDFDVGTTVPFVVPPGTASLTIVSQDVGTSTVRDIRFQGFRIPNTVVPTDVLLPGGELFFSDTDPLPTDAGGYDDVTGVLAYYGGFTPISGSFTIPNTAASLDLLRTDGQVPPGLWSLTVNDWAQECLGITGCSGGSTAGRYRIHTRARSGPIASTGTLDVEVYLATDPAGELPNAAAAFAHPHMARWVQKLAEHFARAGICLGTVTLHDLPDWARNRLAPSGVVDISGAGVGQPASLTPVGCDDLSQLFTVGVAESRAVHLFFAEALEDPTASGPGTVLGIDGSIPGPSGVPGTINGGAILALFDFFGAEEFPGACTAATAPAWSCGTDILAYVAAHEAGHWLGLYHTTEAFGTTFDPLSDTGRCPCVACAPSGERSFCAERGSPSPTFVEASFCTGPSSPIAELASRAVPSASCTGAQNLMFWQFDPGHAQGELSRQQGEVMRLNPAVR